MNGMSSGWWAAWAALVVAAAGSASAQVTLSKTLLTSPANLDQPLAYRLRIANGAGSPALTALGPVTDSMPPGMVFDSASPAADCEPGCDGTTPATITWTNPCATPLAAGGVCDITVNVTAPTANFSNGDHLTNSFSATGTPQSQPSQNLGSAQDTHVVSGGTLIPPPLTADVTVTASASPSPVQSGQRLTYTITVSNNGPDSAASVGVDAVLPSGVTAQTIASDAGVDCSSSSPTHLICSTASLANGGSTVITLGTHVSTAVLNGAAISTTFTVSTTTDEGGATGNDSATVPTAVADVPVVTGVSPNTGPAGGGVSVTITGSSFTGATGVAFGGSPAVSFTINNDGSIMAVPPSGSGLVDVIVTNSNGSSAVVAADHFTYAPPVPTLSQWALGLLGALMAGVAGLLAANRQARSRGRA